MSRVYLETYKHGTKQRFLVSQNYPELTKTIIDRIGHKGL